MAGLTLALLTTAWSGRVVLSISLDRGSLRDSVLSPAIVTHESAVRRIAAIMTRDLKIPLPDRVTLYLYDSAELFEHGLVNDARVAPALAAELSDFAAGVTVRDHLLLLEPGLVARRQREWLRLIAHELTHLAEIELTEGEGRAAQWLSEGTAEWVAATVLERLGIASVAERRALARLAIRDGGPPADLASLVEPRDFIAGHRRAGGTRTYQLAFLLADRLVERHGFGGLLAYFRAFASSPDREANFLQVFGQSADEFEHTMRAELAQDVI
ncbi:MAG: hypothetical protein ACREJG_13770 [Candidatus Rokuibacteriota bacterium]